jgi:hypothetical protein
VPGRLSSNMCLWFDRISLAGVQRRKPDVRGHRHAGGGGDRLLREEPGGGARQARHQDQDQAGHQVKN